MNNIIRLIISMLISTIFIILFIYNPILSFAAFAGVMLTIVIYTIWVVILEDD